MPHKKNPDVFELIRAKCGKLMGLPNQVQLMIHNLPSGYHRDFQILKELIFPSLDELKDCILIASECLTEIEHKDDILDEEKYALAFSVETVNALVQSGMSFRDAYHEVARLIKNDTFNPNKNLAHSHIGSVGNLGLELIEAKLEQNKLGKKLGAVSIRLAKLIEV
jgi:argininosuccinate lyase